MAFGQFSAQPPPEETHCPQCGEAMPANMDVCWLCLQKLIKQDAVPDAEADESKPTEVAIQAGPPKKAGRRRMQSAAVREQTATSDHSGQAIFGFLAIMLCLALAFAAPGALLLLAILCVPALIRTVVAIKRKSEREKDEAKPSQEPRAGLDPVSMFLSSLGIMVVVGLASASAFSAAFFVACFPGFFIAAATNSSLAFVIVTVGASLAFAIFVAFQVYKGFRIKRD